MSADSIFLDTPETTDLGGTLLDFIGGKTSEMFTAAEPMRQLLLDMLGTYSQAISVLAGFIVLYHVISGVVDAAQTGKAWRKINPFWAPLRLIVAITLLVPLGSGLSAGQHLVLKLSGWGGEVASSFWTYASAEIASVKPIVVAPKLPSTLPLIRAVLMKDFCQQATNALVQKAAAQTKAAAATPPLDPPAYSPPRLQPVSQQATLTNPDGSITTPYGWALRPYYCGAVTVFTVNAAQDGPVFAALKEAHSDALSIISNQTTHLATDYLATFWGQTPNTQLAVPTVVADRYQGMIRNITGKKFQDELDAQIHLMQEQTAKDGWIGAATYLDSILRLNVRLVTVMNSLPQVDPPEILLSPPPAPTAPDQQPSPEYRLYETLKRFDASWGTIPNSAPMSNAGLGSLTTLLSQAIAESNNVQGDGSTANRLRQSRELMTLNDYDWDNLTTLNPLAALATFGAYLTGKATALLAGGGVLGSIGPVTGPMVALITTLGIVAYLASMALLLLLPMLPLLRFFLGIAAWLLQILEALIAIPIIALAHLRPEDDGLAGASAIFGYILVLQVALRPVLMIFGLLGGLMVFLVALALLNRLLLFILPTVVSSGQVGVLWFMLVAFGYALFALALSNACFKLIDYLPSRVLPWLSGLISSPRAAHTAQPSATAPAGPAS